MTVNTIMIYQHYEMRRSIVKIVFAALVILALPIQAYAEEWKLTLEESLERAINQNRDIEVARQKLIELEGLKGEAMAQGLPQLIGGSTYQRTWRQPKIFINNTPVTFGAQNTYTATANLNQLLFDGGRVINAVHAAKIEKIRGMENIRDIQERIRLKVKQNFYDILYTEKVISVLDEQLRQLRSHLSSIQTRFSKGIDSDYTLMRQEVEVSNIEPDIIDAKRRKEFLLNEVKILLSIPPEDQFIPDGAFDYRTRALPVVENLIEKAKGNRPDFLAEKLREKSLKENVGVERSGFWPSLNFGMAYQWQAQADSWIPNDRAKVDSLSSTLTLSWNIFDGLKTASRVKQARARLMQQHYTVSQLEDGVERDVRDAYDSLLKARQALESQKKSLDLAKKSTVIAGERFESGLMSQLELNDTIQSQSRAEQNYLRAAFDCLTAEASLEQVVGGTL